jgi:hypothetical protein
MLTLGSRLKALLTAHWAILLPGFASLYIFPYLPELRSPNELCRLHQTRALVDHGTLEINAVLRDEGPVGDLSCVAVARDEADKILERRPCPEVRGQARFSEEHFFPSKAPLLSFAATPVYWVLERWRGAAREVPEVPLVFFSRLICTVLPAVLLLIPLRRFLRAHADSRTADALTAAYGLGSLAFSYAELFMSHQTTAVLVFLTFFAIWRTRRGDWPSWGYALSGLLAGLCVAAEYTAALALVPLAGYALLTAPGGARGRARAALLGMAGVLPVACLLMAYHLSAFGHPLHSGYKYLNDAGYQGWHTSGFLGITVPSGRAFVLSFFSPLRGLFALSPFLAMGMVGLHPRFGSRDCRPELRVCAALLACFAYFTSSFSYDSWGWTTGPRHLTPLVPFLLLPAARVLTAARTRPMIAGSLAGMIGLSILATSAMTFLNYIPDSLTNALYQVALPFLTTGHLPHTWLSLLGVPNPVAGAPALVAVAAAALFAARSALPERLEARSIAAAVGAVSLLVAVHASVRPRTESDRARDASTYTFLEERYVPRPGEASPSFWTR